jgi:hypothetical protein
MERVNMVRIVMNNLKTGYVRECGLVTYPAACFISLDASTATAPSFVSLPSKAETHWKTTSL